MFFYKTVAFYLLCLFVVNMQYVIENIDDLVLVVEPIIALMKAHRIFCFFGDLGAGKTTLIAKICKQLNITDNVSSPTYSIIQTYQYKNDIICHIDLYRINSIEEAIDIGLENYLHQNSCFIEWADNFLEILPSSYIKINIQQQDEKRIIDIHIVQ